MMFKGVNEDNGRVHILAPREEGMCINGRVVANSICKMFEQQAFYNRQHLLVENKGSIFLQNKCNLV